MRFQLLRQCVSGAVCRKCAVCPMRFQILRHRFAQRDTRLVLLSPPKLAKPPRRQTNVRAAVLLSQLRPRRCGQRAKRPMPEDPHQRAEPRLNVKLSSILTTLRRQLREIYGDRLVKLLLYGSQARGQATPWSDIDVMVVLKGRVRPSEEITRTGGIVSEVCLNHDAVIQCLFMDEERFRSMGSPLLRNISREAIEV